MHIRYAYNTLRI